MELCLMAFSTGIFGHFLLALYMYIRRSVHVSFEF